MVSDNHASKNSGQILTFTGSSDVQLLLLSGLGTLFVPYHPLFRSAPNTKHVCSGIGSLGVY